MAKKKSFMTKANAQVLKAAKLAASVAATAAVESMITSLMKSLEPSKKAAELKKRPNVRKPASKKAASRKKRQ